MNYRWQSQIRYDWWHYVILWWFGSSINWQYHKASMTKEEYRKTMRDLIGCHCMGGEL